MSRPSSSEPSLICTHYKSLQANPCPCSTFACGYTVNTNQQLTQETLTGPFSSTHLRAKCPIGAVGSENRPAQPLPETHICSTLQPIPHHSPAPAQHYPPTSLCTHPPRHASIPWTVARHPLDHLCPCSAAPRIPPSAVQRPSPDHQSSSTACLPPGQFRPAHHLS